MSRKIKKADNLSSVEILQSRKNNQRNKMLNIIRSHTDVSRANLKYLTHYSMTTVLSTVDEMIKSGYIYEETCNTVRVGRKPVWLRLNPNGGYFIGLEFNRNLMTSIVMNFRCEEIYRDKHEIAANEKNRDSIILLIKEMLHKAIDFLGEEKNKIIGAGIGVPGYIDKETGTALEYKHLAGWTNVPIKKIVEEEFHIPCYMENNVNVMIYAYKWLVYHGKCEDMILVSIRTGARTVIVSDNHPISSPSGYMGELGHIRVRNGSRLCECGRIGCLNSEISDVAIVNKITEGLKIQRFKELAQLIGNDPDKVTMDVFIRSVKEGHSDSLQLLDQSAAFLGETLAVLVNLFAPTKLVLYGSLASIGTPFISPLKKYIKQDAIKVNYDRLDVEVSSFGEFLGAKGAATYVMQEAFPFVEEDI